MIKIAEKYSNETKELLKTKDDAIENLEKQNVKLQKEDYSEKSGTDIQ